MSSPRHVQDQQLKELIGDAYETSWQTYGVLRMHAELCGQGVRISRKRVTRLMRELGIEGVSRRRGRKRTTVQAEAAKAALICSSAASRPSGRPAEAHSRRRPSLQPRQQVHLARIWHHASRLGPVASMGSRGDAV